ncbi:MAG: hypothetical protein H6732_07980 [Alphaproteobacteria bacterium]|nr:hypothetical protein [Alphaproteobacteria bacterium]
MTTRPRRPADPEVHPATAPRGASRVPREGAAPGRLRRADGAALCVALLLVAVGGWWTLAHPELAAPKAEEEVNIALAVALPHTSPLVWAHLLRFPFCGGCFGDAAVAAGLFGVLPSTLGTWRLVPGLWMLLGAGAGFLWLRTRVHPIAGWAWAALVALPPPTLASLTWIAWGNHVEGTWIALVGLALADRSDPDRLGDLAAGVVLGSGVAFAPATAPLAAVGAAHVALRRGPARAVVLAGGLLVAPLWWQIIHGLVGVHPLASLSAYLQEVHTERSWADQLWDLVGPGRSAWWIARGRVPVAVVTAAQLAGLAALGLSLRARNDATRQLLTATVAGFCAGYVLSRGSAHDLDLRPGLVLGLRYMGPLIILLLLVVAASAGAAWRDGRRALAAALVLPWLAVGAAGRVAEGQATFSPGHLLRQEVPDWRRVAITTRGRSWRWAEAMRCTPGDRACARLAAVGRGKAAAYARAPLPATPAGAEDPGLAAFAYGAVLPGCVASDREDVSMACLQATATWTRRPEDDEVAWSAQLRRLADAPDAVRRLPPDAERAAARWIGAISVADETIREFGPMHPWEVLRPEAQRALFQAMGDAHARAWGPVMPAPGAAWPASWVAAYRDGAERGLRAGWRGEVRPSWWSQER